MPLTKINAHTNSMKQEF